MYTEPDTKQWVSKWWDSWFGFHCIMCDEQS